METKEKYYIVSFSDSKKYLYEEKENDHLESIQRVEKELNSYLRTLFPDETFAYFTTPRLTEINPEHLARYSGYPRFDEHSILGPAHAISDSGRQV